MVERHNSILTKLVITLRRAKVLPSLFVILMAISTKQCLLHVILITVHDFQEMCIILNLSVVELNSSLLLQGQNSQLIYMKVLPTAYN